jgi:hypothetical protein
MVMGVVVAVEVVLKRLPLNKIKIRNKNPISITGKYKLINLLSPFVYFKNALNYLFRKIIDIILIKCAIFEK